MFLKEHLYQPLEKGVKFWCQGSVVAFMGFVVSILYGNYNHAQFSSFLSQSISGLHLIYLFSLVFCPYWALSHARVLPSMCAEPSDSLHSACNFTCSPQNSPPRFKTTE